MSSSERHHTYRFIREIVPDPVRALLYQLIPCPVRTAIIRLIGSSLGAHVEQYLSRRKLSQLKWDKGIVDADQVRLDLQAVSFPPGSVVMIHSSLSALGFVRGGAETVVDALVEVIVGSGGTLAMPAFTIDGNMYNTARSDRIFHAGTARSRMGAITEAFRTLAGTVRSIHPTHSVSAYGPKATWLVEGHESCGSTFGIGSPFGKLLDTDGCLMGLGIDLGCVTFYHSLEDRHVDFPIRVYTSDSPLESLCYDTAGAEHRVLVKCHDPDQSKTRIDKPAGRWIRHFLTTYLESKGYLKWYTIGAGRAWIIRAKDMYDSLEWCLTYNVTIYSTKEEIVALDLPPDLAAVRDMVLRSAYVIE